MLAAQHRATRHLAAVGPCLQHLALHSERLLAPAPYFCCPIPLLCFIYHLWAHPVRHPLTHTLPVRPVPAGPYDQVISKAIPLGLTAVGAVLCVRGIYSMQVCWGMDRVVWCGGKGNEAQKASLAACSGAAQLGCATGSLPLR